MGSIAVKKAAIAICLNPQLPERLATDSRAHCGRSVCRRLIPKLVIRLRAVIGASRFLQLRAGRFRRGLESGLARMKVVEHHRNWRRSLPLTFQRYRMNSW